MGGVPLTLTSTLKKGLLKFKFVSIIIQQTNHENRNAGIIPVFVFSGLTTSREEKPNYGILEKIKKRRSAWSAYERGQVDVATTIFLSTCSSTVSIDYINAIFKYFKQNNVEYFRAPYLSFAQVII